MLLPTAPLQADLDALRVYLALAGPKPPQSPLARLIVSSIASRSTEPADGVRAAMGAYAVRRLLRLRRLAMAAAPHALAALDRQIARAAHLATGRAPAPQLASHRNHP